MTEFVTLIQNNFYTVNSISDNWNDNLQSLNQGKNEASGPVFYAVRTSVPVP